MAKRGMTTNKLAIYDMDKTISVRPTYTSFLIQTALRIAPWRLVLAPLAGVLGLAYMAGLVGRSRLKELNFLLFLGNPHSDRLEWALNRFADTFVRKNLRQEAVAQIAADRQAGYRIVLATASFQIYVAFIAARLGVDDVIATKLRTIDGGKVAARIDGVNCYGADKLAMIHNWLKDQAITPEQCDIRCYSDHFSDSHMLELATQACAVNADPRLRLLAKERGWTIVDWT
jgi:HAD superfamily hydrolase (TIGR01490 family)